MIAAALPRSVPRDRQAAIGLTLAALVIGGWLGLHAFTLFIWRPEGGEWLWAVPLVAVQSWLSVGLFITAHDAMHGSLVPGCTGVNRAMGRLALTVYAGFSYDRLTRAHWQHHEAPGSADDPDFCAEHPTSFGRWYLGFLTRYFGWSSFLFINAVVGLLLLAGVPIANLLLLYALPSILSSVQLFAFGTYLPHRHDGLAFADRHNSRTNDWGTLASLASCYHFGYHHEHHLSPHVPWWRLPARRRQALAAEGRA